METGLYVFSGKELKVEIKVDYDIFRSEGGTIDDWFDGYSTIQDDKYYLVTSELRIVDESIQSVINYQGVLYS